MVSEGTTPFMQARAKSIVLIELLRYGLWPFGMSRPADFF